MIYRVVIIDNGNQVSLTQQGNCTACFQIEGVSEVCEDVINAMSDALDILKSIEKIDGGDNER